MPIHLTDLQIKRQLLRFLRSNHIVFRCHGSIDIGYTSTVVKDGYVITYLPSSKSVASFSIHYGSAHIWYTKFVYFYRVCSPTMRLHYRVGLPLQFKLSC